MRVHVDMSGKYSKRKTIGIAACSEDKKWHIGLAIKNPLLEKIKEELQKEKDFSKLHAICVYHLIKERKKEIDELVLCNDEPFPKVKKELIKLNRDKRIHIISLTTYRERKGEKRLRSPADNLANSYRKRAARTTKREKGKKLNEKRLTYREIVEYWRKNESR